MARNKDRRPRWLVLVSTVLAIGLGGCAAMPEVGGGAPAQQAAKAQPRVENCGIVSIGSPTKYVCDGKVYTSFQLAKIREGENKAQ